jgi:hypothetical protein
MARPVLADDGLLWRLALTVFVFGLAVISAAGCMPS